MKTIKSIVDFLLLTAVLFLLKGVGADFVQSLLKSDGLCQIPFDDKSDVTFSLYTRKNQNTPELLEVKDGKVNSKYFNPKNKLKVLTHGWLENGSIQLLIQWLLDIKDAYLETEDMNVILVDWNSFCEYIMASVHTNEVGKEIAELLDALHNSYGTTGKDIHLIGHSLGAHVVGAAGKNAKQRVSRITGLDPARPLFEVLYLKNGLYHRLQKSDAEFVDIIHTCAGLYGYAGSIGHADFYPNGVDAPQPGCLPVVSGLVWGCSHARSRELFRESINTKVGFYSYPCEDHS